MSNRFWNVVRSLFAGTGAADPPPPAPSEPPGPRGVNTPGPSRSLRTPSEASEARPQRIPAGPALPSASGLPNKTEYRDGSPGRYALPDGARFLKTPSQDSEAGATSTPAPAGYKEPRVEWRRPPSGRDDQSRDGGVDGYVSPKTYPDPAKGTTAPWNPKVGR